MALVATVSALATVLAVSRVFSNIEKPTLPANNAVGVATKTHIIMKASYPAAGARRLQKYPKKGGGLVSHPAKRTRWRSSTWQVKPQIQKMYLMANCRMRLPRLLSGMPNFELGFRTPLV